LLAPLMHIRKLGNMGLSLNIALQARAVSKPFVPIKAAQLVTQAAGQFGA
jgi:hypothetical protein